MRGRGRELLLPEPLLFTSLFVKSPLPWVWLL